MNTTTSKLWTVNDVLEYGQYKSRTKVYALIKEGMPHIKSGHSVRFKPESVMQFLESKEVKGA